MTEEERRKALQDAMGLLQETYDLVLDVWATEPKESARRDTLGPALSNIGAANAAIQKAFSQRELIHGETDTTFRP